MEQRELDLALLKFTCKVLRSAKYTKDVPEETMVQLIATDSLKTKLNALGDVKNDGAQLPLELLEAIQAHLDAKEAWIEHKLLARISRWNKTSARELHFLAKWSSCTSLMTSDTLYRSEVSLYTSRTDSRQ